MLAFQRLRRTSRSDPVGVVRSSRYPLTSSCSCGLGGFLGGGRVLFLESGVETAESNLSTDARNERLGMCRYRVRRLGDNKARQLVPLEPEPRKMHWGSHGEMGMVTIAPRGRLRLSGRTTGGGTR